MCLIVAIYLLLNKLSFRIPMDNTKYVQYGCGFSAPSGWINFDASPTLRIERLPLMGQFIRKNAQPFPGNIEYGNIIKGLPISKNSCDGVYCSHILEHLALTDFRKALHNTRDILKNDGIFRLVVPDLEFFAKQYLDSDSPEAASQFMRDTYLGYEVRHTSFFGFIKDWFGNNRHLWMWDYKALSKELSDAGFTNIRRAQFNDSSDEHFKLVEIQERWNDCLGIECKK